MKIIRVITTQLETNTYIVINGERAFVVDPGDSADEICHIAERENAKIECVLLTHGHFDHTGAAAKLQKTGALVIIHKADARIISSFKNMAFLTGAVVEKFTPDITVVGGESLNIAGMTVKVVHTPGHSEGGVCYIVDDIIFVGDTIFCCSYGNTSMPGGDFKKLKNSIINKVFALKGDFKLFAGHGDETTLEFERRNNPILFDND